MKKMFCCNQCGLCCRNIHLVPDLKDFNIGEGVCKYLDLQTNKCLIYNERPLVCNVEKSFESIYSAFMSEDKYILLNQKGCELLWTKKKL